MAITSITTLAGLRTRIRFISGIKAEEIDDDEAIDEAIEHFRGLDVNELTADTGLPTAIAGTDSSNNTRKFTYANLFQAKGKRVELDATDTGVASSFSGGITTWTITLSDAWVSGVVGTNCMVEVCDKSDGQTVYAEVERSSTTVTIKMTSGSLIANNLYFVLLNNIA